MHASGLRYLPLLFFVGLWAPSRLVGAEPTTSPPKEITNSIGMKFTLIPAGEFTMGSPTSEAERRDEERQHRVVISMPFHLGVHEVTQFGYWRVMGRNPSHFCRTGEKRRAVRDVDTARFPVETVSWEDATDFCRRLSGLPEEMQMGRLYRLPTEAEWEYACRAGTTSVFHFGDSLSSTQANFNGSHLYRTSHESVDLRRPTDVGSYQPNAWGLYDMHGNVWEFCQDWYSEDYYQNSPAYDPIGPPRGRWRVLRGGAWGYRAENCRSAARLQGPPRRNEYGGFRVVLVHSAR